MRLDPTPAPVGQPLGGPPAVVEALRRVLDSGVAFTLQKMIDAAARHGGHWRQAVWTLEQWRLQRLVVSATRGVSMKTHWKKV